MKTTEELKELVDRFMRKIGATWVFIPPLGDSKDGSPDVYAMFLNINVLFHVYIKSREEYTDTWALRQVLNYDEQHTKCFDTKLGVTKYKEFDLYKPLYEEPNLMTGLPVFIIVKDEKLEFVRGKAGLEIQKYLVKQKRKE